MYHHHLTPFPIFPSQVWLLQLCANTTLQQLNHLQQVPLSGR